MTARQENRYKANSIDKARQLNTESAQQETMRREHREVMTTHKEQWRNPDKRTVNRWMQRNSLGYDSATELAEAAACAFDFGGTDPLSDEAHWLWDMAADCFDC
jgi:hypothetical protein